VSFFMPFLGFSSIKTVLISPTDRREWDVVEGSRLDRTTVPLKSVITSSDSGKMALDHVLAIGRLAFGRSLVMTRAL